MFRRMKQRLLSPRKKSTNKKINHDARPRSGAGPIKDEVASSSPKKVKKLQRKNMLKERKNTEPVERVPQRVVDESESDVFETASEGEEGGDSEGTILAGAGPAQNNEANNEANNDANNDESVDDTLIENESNTTTTTLPQETYEFPFSKLSALHPHPLLTQTYTTKTVFLSTLSRLNARLESLTLSVQQCRGLVLRLTALNARIDGLAARYKRIRLLTEMFTEEPEKLTEEYRVYIEEEMGRIEVLDREVYEETERVTGEWRSVVDGWAERVDEVRWKQKDGVEYR